MTEPETIPDQITQIKTLLSEKHGVRANDLTRALEKAQNRIPRRVYKEGLALARAEPLLAHPKLSRTLDTDRLTRAAGQIRAHLDTIDVADRRKGWILGMLGALVFNLLAFGAILIVFLVWQGYL